MKLILVRHGHVDGIQPERFRGRSDMPLTPLGELQAAATASRIHAEWPIDAIFTSPLRRCVATGAAIAAATGATATTCRNFIDLDYGDWNGKTHADVRESSRDLYEAWHLTPHLVRFPGGDSLQDLAARAAEGVRELLREHAGQTVAVVAHDSVNRALLLQFANLSLADYWRFRQEPACVNEIDCGAATEIRRINETWHLFDIR